MRLLVIRTSAMGDVALTTPVLAGMMNQYPEVEILFLTRSAFKPFFTESERLQLFIPDFNNRHKGIPGLFRLYKDINKISKIDYVIDLHDVLRSKILRILFILSGVPSAVIDKGRGEKRKVIRGELKGKLKHSVERYMDTFSRAGFPVTSSEGPWIIPSSGTINKAISLIGLKDGLNIGVAPYAKHKLKMWPEGNMVTLLRILSDKYKARFWLFGGKDESERLSEFQSKIPGSDNVSGKLNLEEELALISKLDLMIAMDSSNMHMAALVGTKVISIWGGTDPVSGFGAWMQPERNAVSIPVSELKCRPCTIYGKGECRRGDFACMIWLTPEKVFERIDMELNKK